MVEIGSFNHALEIFQSYELLQVHRQHNNGNKEAKISLKSALNSLFTLLIVAAKLFCSFEVLSLSVLQISHADVR